MNGVVTPEIADSLQESQRKNAAACISALLAATNMFRAFDEKHEDSQQVATGFAYSYNVIAINLTL